MLGLGRKWMFVAIVVGVLKVLLAIVSNGSSDFLAFIYLARGAFLSLGQGQLFLSGAYTGIGLLGAPFFALWSVLPINHPLISGMIGPTYFVTSPEGLLLVLSMKLPFFAFDLFTGVLVFWLVRDLTTSDRRGGIAFLLWYLNPYNIFMIEIWGSFDIVPAAILLLAVLLALRSRWVKSGVSLFLATVLRVFPVLLLPVFVLSEARNGLKRASLAFAVSYSMLIVLSLMVFRLGSLQAIGDFVVNTSSSSPWILPILYGLPISSGLDLAPNVLDVPLSLVLFALPVQLYVIMTFWKKKCYSILDMTLAFLLVYFASTIHEPYHFTWVTPLLTAYVVMKKDRPTLLGYLFFSAFLAMLVHSDISAGGSAFFLLIPFNDSLRNAAVFLNTLRNEGTIFVEFEGFYQGILHGLIAAFAVKVNLSALGLPSKSYGAGNKPGSWRTVVGS